MANAEHLALLKQCMVSPELNKYPGKDTPKE
jgi:hypothetical protein